MPVATSFSDARDAVISSVDAKLAEDIRLSPMKVGVTDPLRAQIVIAAVLRTGDQKVGPLDAPGARSLHSRIAAGKAALYIDRTKYPDVALVKGDVIRAISRPGKPKFEVASVDDRYHARLIVHLNQA